MKIAFYAVKSISFLISFFFSYIIKILFLNCCINAHLIKLFWLVRNRVWICNFIFFLLHERLCLLLFSMDKKLLSFKVKNVGCKLCDDYTDNKLEKHNLFEKENNLMNFRGKLFLNGRIT